MTGAPGTGIYYSTLISSFSHTYKQRHLNLPNGFFFKSMNVIHAMSAEKKLNLVLTQGWGGVFYPSHKLVIKNEIGRC